MCFFFFFQAEDGIRDFHVTGVQTCALPILETARLRAVAPPQRRVVVVGAGLAGLAAATELARSGHDVSVLEQGGRAGGRAACAREQGFALEAFSPVLSGA